MASPVRGLNFTFGVVFMVWTQGIGVPNSSSGELSLDCLIKGLLGITYSQSLIRINIFDGDLIRIATTARRFISDFIDCIVLATAAMQADILLTEDTLLLKPPHNLQEYIHSINPRLQIFDFRDYTQKYKS